MGLGIGRLTSFIKQMGQAQSLRDISSINVVRTSQEALDLRCSSTPRERPPEELSRRGKLPLSRRQPGGE
ncbi:hypothetical protein BRARA_H02255 [Brassica rapa]|uniref:Uncharacterized protein n=1 Tax=Brassica campestris TaxID=3711 RepID=A0A397YIB9_BRACM|nr:hypothetical protein BRARA_H02255 [Brassica rapa]